MTDNVNHPHHYADNGPFECIELTEQFDFCVGNAIKYVWRHNDKGKPLEDLSKALWYLKRERNRAGDIIYVPLAYKTSNRQLLNKLIVTDHANMSDFWNALNKGNLWDAMHAVQKRFDTLFLEEATPECLE